MEKKQNTAIVSLKATLQTFAKYVHDDRLRLEQLRDVVKQQERAVGKSEARLSDFKAGLDELGVDYD